MKLVELKAPETIEVHLDVKFKLHHAALYCLFLAARCFRRLQSGNILQNFHPLLLQFIELPVEVNDQIGLFEAKAEAISDPTTKETENRANERCGKHIRKRFQTMNALVQERKSPR